MTYDQHSRMSTGPNINLPLGEIKLKLMNIFPSGIAEGEAFCNRKAERNQLKANIEKNRHSILIAPRRYGKTSLIRQVMLDNDYNYVWVDFLSTTTKEEVQEKLKKAVKEMLLQLAPELKKLHLKTKNFIQSMAPELNLSALGQKLTLHLNSDQSLSIDDLLLQVDQYAQTIGKTAVFVFDEFQQISEIRQHSIIEALIRHAVERSKSITYLFSGSNRHLLGEMFSKSNKPLYRLCQALIIDRIVAQEYLKFLNDAAQKHWGHDLSEGVLQTILNFTECHPFYVNQLCAELWSRKHVPKTEQEVAETWYRYIDNNKSIIIADIISLPLNQKRIITALAHQVTKEPYGSEFAFRTKIPTSSIRRTIETLLAKDIIYINTENEYYLLDPAIRHYLIRH